MPVILDHLILSEEISFGPGKEWTYLGHFLLLAQWSGIARSGWPSAVEWMMQNVLPLCSLSSLQISNQSAFFLQSCKVFVVLCITSSVYRFALQGGVWKSGSMPFCALKTLVFILEENFCSRYRIMATVYYFTHLKMSLNCILMSIVSDEKISYH